jgi:hypothetical protein
MRRFFMTCTLAAVLAGCASGYTLVPAAVPAKVAAASFTVTPSAAWNKAPRGVDQPKYEEVWTADGPLLNSVTFYGGVPEGKALIKQRKKAEQQAPLFKASMLPQEVAEFVESTYRVTSGSTAFTVSSLRPATFAGAQGFAMDFDYVLQSDEVKRRGRAIGAIKDKKLYMMIYEGTATHYFDLYASEFDKVAASAQIISAGNPS